MADTLMDVLAPPPDPSQWEPEDGTYPPDLDMAERFELARSLVGKDVQLRLVEWNAQPDLAKWKRGSRVMVVADLCAPNPTGMKNAMLLEVPRIFGGHVIVAMVA